MATKHGQLLWHGNGFLLQRLQTAGPDSISLSEEKVDELGNFESVATVRDTAELGFSVESWDMSTDFEAKITGVNPASVLDGDEFDFADAIPLDITSPWKNSSGVFAAAQGVAIPYLSLENVTYRFGVGQNATQLFTFRTDSIYFIPGTPYYQEFAAAGTGPYAFTNAAIKTVEQGDDVFALCVTVVNSDGTYERLFHGEDYTDTSAGFTLTEAAPVGSTLHVVYGSLVIASFPQSVHDTDSVRPAAIRGRDIDVYVSDGAATPELIRWKGVQSIEVTRRVTLENEQELGNPHFVASDYDTPEVSGTVTMRPATAAYLFEIVAQIAGVPSNEIVNTLSSLPLDLRIVINHPTTGDPIKTLRVDDARFSPPAPQGRVNQKLEVQLPFSSDGGDLDVVAGAIA